MKFTFIAAKRAEHSVSILCRCLAVTRSGFYAWRRRPESTHVETDRRLRVLIRASLTEVADALAVRASTPIWPTRTST